MASLFIYRGAKAVFEDFLHGTAQEVVCTGKWNYDPQGVMVEVVDRDAKTIWIPAEALVFTNSKRHNPNLKWIGEGQRPTIGRQASVWRPSVRRE